MYECPICKRRCFYHNMRWSVKEHQASGLIVVHEMVCLNCKLEIDRRNAVFVILRSYFDNHNEHLTRLRSEFADNSKGVNQS